MKINNIQTLPPQWEKLQKYLRKIQRLNASLALLSWDQETWMPEAAAQERASQIELLSDLLHQWTCADELGEHIASAQSAPHSEFTQRLLDLIIKDRAKALQIPAELNAKLAHTTSLAQQAWVKARSDKDPSLFLPYLAEVFNLKNAEAKCFTGDPYEVLLDQYEPKLQISQLDSIFAELNPFLVEITKELSTHKYPELKGPFPVEAQKSLGNSLLQAIGFNTHTGRLDVSAHPFTMGIHPSDVRLTARYNENCLEDGLFSILHEGGHGLYEQGLPADWAWSPLGSALSLGMHESQSRFWENLIGRSRPFWHKHFAAFQSHFPNHQGDLNHFLQAIHRVKPSMIRVDADEVTYNLHVQIRYEIEKDLFAGAIQVQDIEELWNCKMQSYLGICPANPFEGYLQDVHWSAGLIGYFPTYTLGNLISAQLGEFIQADLGSFDEILSKNDGEIQILHWLRNKIHQHGRLYSTTELLQKEFHSTLDVNAFKNYLRQNYLSSSKEIYENSTKFN